MRRVPGIALRAAHKARPGYSVFWQNTEKVIVTPDGAPLGQKKCHPHSLKFGGVSSIRGALKPSETFDDCPAEFIAKAPFVTTLNGAGQSS